LTGSASDPRGCRFYSIHLSSSFRRSVASTLSQSGGDQISNHSSESSGTQKNIKKTRQRLVISDSESDGSDNSSEEPDETEPNQPLKRFLAAYSLEEHFELLNQHQIDLDTLILLTEDDLRFLNLPLGPYRRLAVAIQERKSALANPGAIIDSRL
jgi:Usher syndrome type-1G protein